MYKVTLCSTPTKQVGHDVIADYHGNRQQEPEEAFKCVLNDEVSRAAKQEQRDVSPGVLHMNNS